MSNIPTIAIVLEGGVVQTTLIEGWPSHLSRPHIVVVDYDTEGMPENELTSFGIGNDVLTACCHVQTPDAYETFDTPALSPRAVFAALGELDRDENSSPTAI